MDEGLVLDVMKVAEMVGEGLERGEDDGVTEDTGLHVVLEPPVDHQLVLAGESGGADGAVVLLLVVEVLVLLPRLLRKEVLLAPGVTTPPQIVLEEEVSSAVGEDHVTDVTVVLLVGVAGPDHHAVLLGDLGAGGVLGEGPVTEVILQRTVGESLE